MAQKWAVFTSLKAKKTAQTKPYKTTLHTTESEKQPAWLASLITRSTWKDRSQTRVPSLKLKICISPAESVLSKVRVALHGSVCSKRHSWHIRLATLSKSHLLRFLCYDLLTLLFLNAPCPKTYFTLKRRPASRPLKERAILVTESNKRERTKKDILFCSRLTPPYTNIGWYGTYIPCIRTVHIHTHINAYIMLWSYTYLSRFPYS